MARKRTPSVIYKPSEGGSYLIKKADSKLNMLNLKLILRALFPVVLIVSCISISLTVFSVTQSDAPAVQVVSVKENRNTAGNSNQSSPDNNNAVEAEVRADSGNVHFKRGTRAATFDVFDREMSEALEQYKIAESLDPGKAIYHINVGAALNRLGRYEEAITHLRQGVELDPSLAWYHNELCVALKRLKRFNEAEPECTEAIRQDKGNAKFQDDLEKVLERAEYARKYDPSASTNASPKMPSPSPVTTNNTQLQYSTSLAASWIFGSALLVFLCLVVFILKHPTHFQVNIVRFLMALTAGFFALFFVGGVLLDGTIAGLAISATGGFVLFVLLQFVFDPFKVLPRTTDEASSGDARDSGKGSSAPAANQKSAVVNKEQEGSTNAEVLQWPLTGDDDLDKVHKNLNLLESTGRMDEEGLVRALKSLFLRPVYLSVDEEEPEVVLYVLCRMHLLLRHYIHYFDNYPEIRKKILYGTTRLIKLEQEISTIYGAEFSRIVKGHCAQYKNDRNAFMAQLPARAAELDVDKCNGILREINDTFHSIGWMDQWAKP